MFRLSRSKKAPVKAPANPGLGTELTTAFANGECSWTEEVDLVKVLGDVLKAAGHRCKTRKGWVELSSGMTVLPQFIAMQPLEDGGASTTTTIQVAHTAGIPGNVFEYQHATGVSMVDSFQKGFQSWLDLDFTVLNDSLQKDPEHSMVIQIPYPKGDGGKPNFRRVLLGPMTICGQYPQREDVTDEIHQPQCPCCFFRSLAEEMKEHLEGNEFIGIRFYGLRNEDGTVEADCRLNGEDWDPGKLALIRFVETWPGRGFEFRKQYGILQSVADSFDSSDNPSLSA